MTSSRAILMVTGGELSGARMNLEIGQFYSVGGDEACDIVLRGAVPDNASMQITLNAEGLRVTHSDRHESADAAYHDELSFGSSKFCIVQSTGMSTPSVPTLANPIDTELFDTKSVKRQHRFMRPVLYAAAIMAFASGAVGLALWQGGSATKSIASVVPVESLLANAGFEHLQVDRSTKTAVISGYVPSRQEALSLAQIIATHSEPVLNRVQVDAEIRDQIENVLRVNGIAGLVESGGNGTFVANTQLPLGGQLDGLQGMIERDVPSVASFSVNNQLPVVVKPANDAIQLDSGKRVVLVNSEKPSYVVTEDESRYFVGSILPGGYRITDITSGRVLLEKQGNSTELKF